MSDLPDVKTFSVLDALKGRSYPKAEVTVYSDVEAYHEWADLTEQANLAETGSEGNALEPRIAELREQIKNSGFKFYMQGYAPGVQKRLMAEARAKFQVDGDDFIRPGSEAFRWVNLASVAASILKVEKLIDGSVDERKFTVEDVEFFEDYLPPEEFDKLATKAFELSFRAMAFDQAVDSDF